MRVAVLSDIHGNRLAFEACLRWIDRFNTDRMFFLGDAVGYLPDEGAVLAQLSVHGIECQKGNHESYLMAPTLRSLQHDDLYALKAVRRRLPPDTLEKIALWPESREIQLGERRALMIHGAPTAPLEGYLYPDTDLSPYEHLPYDVVFMGNTHRPFVRRAGRALFVNVGSIGLPRDQGDLASFCVYDTTSDFATIFRVHFDAAMVLDLYGPAIHSATKACLARRSLDVVGEIIA